MHHGGIRLGARMVPLSVRIAIEPHRRRARPGIRCGRGAAGARLGISCVVTVLPPGSVPRTKTGKARRLVRWSEGEPLLPGLR